MQETFHAGRHAGYSLRKHPARRSTGTPCALLFVALALFTLPAAADVEHVVFCWLKEPGNTEAARQVISSSLELREVPGVLDIVAGPPLASDRPVVDDSFDVGLVMKFADAAAMQAYLDHPEHVRRVNEIFRPLCGRIQIHDIQH